MYDFWCVNIHTLQAKSGPEFAKASALHQIRGGVLGKQFPSIKKRILSKAIFRQYRIVECIFNKNILKVA